MSSIVLSGGGNYGAMQAGALEVLLRERDRPDLLVGNSAGALNAIYLAADPTVEGMWHLQGTWRAVTEEHVGSLSLLRGLGQVILQGESLFPNRPLIRFLETHLPQGIETFGELRVENEIAVYAVAAKMRGGGPRVFGDRPDDRLLDGAMASAALPPYFAPWEVEGERFVDGGMYSNLPLRIAVDRGARDILALWIRPPTNLMGQGRGLLQITSTAFNLMSQSLSAAEIDVAERSGVRLNVLELHPPEDIEFWDFGQPDRLIEAGRAAAQSFLAEKRKESAAPWRTWPGRLSELLRRYRSNGETETSGIAN